VAAIELAAAAAVVARPLIFFCDFFAAMLIPDGQDDLTDALPVEVDLRSWSIVRTATCQKGLTAMVNQMSLPPMVYELHLRLRCLLNRKGRGT
jgi:hypothetical protein